MFNEVIFDLETKSFFVEDGKFDPSKFGVSVVSLYTRKLDENFKELEGEMLSFWEEGFTSMWKIFRQADRIIGFNSIGFDVPALSPYSPSGFSKLPHFDILDRIKKVAGHKTSLQKIAQATLGTQKTDSGENAIAYWQKHDPKSLTLLKKYCQDDVRITKEIYDFGLKNKKLLFTDYWNNPREIEVDFSYSEDILSSPQPSLF
jgi:DEAD/DEAH box helicase domain-containing protein